MFSLGNASKQKLMLVKPILATVAARAIELTKQDFTVQEGLRSIETQRIYMKRGATRTMKSRHLTGDAVDLVPWLEGQPRWEWSLIYPIAVAMRQAAIEHKVNMTWGGVWDRRLVDLPATVAGIKREVEAYSKRHPGPDFLDGPHYQLED